MEMQNPANYRQVVREVQMFLREIAYHEKRLPLLSIDGIYSQKVAQAVSIFQEINGLPVTGEVNETTWNEIYRQYKTLVAAKAPPASIIGLPSPNTVLRIGDTGPSVYYLQIMLNELAKIYNNISAVDINGIYDRKTHNAVETVKQSANLNGQGVDRFTWDAIASLYNTSLK